MRVNTILKPLLAAAAAAAMLGVAPAHAQTAPAKPAAAAPASAPLSKGDQQILIDMAQANMAEVESAKMAQGKTQNADVKTFAQQMIDDHTKAGADFKAALAEAKVTPPKPGLDLTHTAKYEKLNLFTTDQGFDASYVATQLDAHKDAVALFEDYVQNGSPGPVKDFAEKTLPTLKHHLEMATALNAKYNPA
jgi:putative membrane protein